MVDTLTRKANMAENPALYYSVARTMGTKNSIQSLVADYLKECTRLDHDIESIADPGAPSMPKISCAIFSTRFGLSTRSRLTI